MQFKHPEILYFLALLIIPILVHLFQLQRFVKVPFTNVVFLEKLAMQTRKSSQLKKWLILLTRILLLSALILAFAQPYLSNNSIEQQKHTLIYLDNSLSTSAKGKKGNLLKIAAQEIIENSTKDKSYSLLTNTNFYQNLSQKELKTQLLKVKNRSKKASFDEVLLKIESQEKQKTNTLNKNILISDFQDFNSKKTSKFKKPLSLVQLVPEQQNNIAIDSVFISNISQSTLKVNTVVRNNGNAKRNIPIAIYNKEKLISKQTFSINENSKKTITFSVQKVQSFLGTIKITFNDTFNFDNQTFFSLTSKEKINVLAIGDNNVFLSKIYTKNEFNFTTSKVRNINYNSIGDQQLIILNELEKLPKTLQLALVEFCENGGSLIVIPSSKTEYNSYNSLFKNISSGKILPIKNDTLKITKIHFSHPLLNKVFEKKIQNFQYPKVNSYFPTTLVKSTKILSFENQKAFISQVNLKKSKLFWVASPLNISNSNFTNSPLIVPVFYNIGKQSLALSKLYYTLDEPHKIDISTRLGKDEILTLQGKTSSFIPIQQTFQNKVSITTKDKPEIAGFYSILKKNDTLQTIAFNNPKQESSLKFLDVNQLSKENPNLSISNSVAKTLQTENLKNKIHWLWQWFLALAIVFLLLEILILKYFKV